MNEILLAELLTRISWHTPIQVQDTNGKILHRGEVERLADPTNPFDTNQPVEGLHTENNYLFITITAHDDDE